MQSNWPVVYRSSQPHRGPGPFEEYVLFRNRWVSKLRSFGVPSPVNGEFLEGVSRVTNFVPAPLPTEWHVSAPLAIHAYFRATCGGGSDDLPIVAAVGRSLRAGPKLFRPAARECEPLEHVELSLPADDYRLPFPVCVVEFPPDYATDRIIPSTVLGESVRPGFCVVCQEGGVVVAGLAYPVVVGDVGWDFYTVGVSQGRFEDMFDRHATSSAKHVPFLRAALNYLLLAAGANRVISPPDPTQVRSIRRRIKRASKERNKDKLEELRTRLRRLPSVYALSQEIRLFDREQPPPDPNPDADGSPKSPHWRKGHWRRVAVGTGRAERKVVFIPPVLVNGHLLPG
jgi:hypothetical protein